MLEGLRLGSVAIMKFLPGADAKAGITVLPEGDWDFHIAFEDIRPDDGVPIHNIEFTMERNDAVLFTFSIPVYWAIMLGAGVNRKNLRQFLLGTLVMMAIEAVFLVTHAKSMANIATESWHPNMSELNRWWIAVLDRIVTSVFPFFSPIIMALVFHKDLRKRILGDS